jgi:putative Mn2+ efflux pump MntP
MLIGIIISIFLTGVSLSMDAFAVSICDGMIYKDLNKKKGLTIPLTFGVFQAIMPIIGFYVGLLVLEYIEAYDHWIAFILLLFIGGKMVIDGIKELKAGEEEGEEVKIKKFSYPEVLVQGVATSIDALAVGFSLNAMLEGVSNLQLAAWLSVCAIGIITFCISLAGLVIGIKVGKLFKKKASVAEIIGGIVLIGIGLKILIEGLI